MSQHWQNCQMPFPLLRTISRGEIWASAELTLDLGWDRWLEDSLAWLIVAPPVVCCKASFRNPPTALGWELPKFRVISTSSAEHQHILAERLNQCDDQRFKAGGKSQEAEDCPWSGWKLVSLPKESPGWGSRCWEKAAGRPFLANEGAETLQETLRPLPMLWAGVQPGKGQMGRAGSAGWRNGKFVPRWMIPVLFLGYVFQNSLERRSGPSWGHLLQPSPLLPAWIYFLYCRHGRPPLASLSIPVPVALGPSPTQVAAT